MSRKQPAAAAAAPAAPAVEKRPRGYTPAIIRRWVREQMTTRAMNRLMAIGVGKTAFQEVVILNIRGGGQHYQVVGVKAPANVQVQALRTVVGVAIPTQVGLVDDQDRPTPGVVVLPQATAGRAIDDGPVTLHRGDALEEVEEIVERGAARAVTPKRKAPKPRKKK